MIIQGTNNPLIFTFDVDMSTIKDIEICLYDVNKVELKHWTIDEVLINEKEISAPIRQEESLDFPAGKCFIEIKWIDAFGKTNFGKLLTNTIVDRYDKTIMEGAN